MLDKKIYNKIMREFKGKSGGPEAESILVDNNEERKSGLIEVYVHGKNAAKIAERCWPAITAVKFEGEAVTFTIKRTAFRGVHTAFKIVKGE
jgi:hypothetical protein